MKIKLVSSFVVAMIMSMSATALAEGTTSRIDSIVKLTPDHSKFDEFQGVIESGSRSIYWGGSLCPGPGVPSNTDLQMIAAAKASGLTVNIMYVAASNDPYKACYKGFGIVF